MEQTDVPPTDTAWKKEHESILIDWADKAMCYRWLHSEAHQQFAKYNKYFTIPVIILSTLTGTANFAQDRIPVDFRPYFVMAIGSLNIIAGIISTIQQFLKINELNEAHRVSAISWDKFYRNIKVEIAKSPSERLDVNHMLKICKEEFDRLMETSPTINNDIIKKFNTTFKDNPAFKEVKKPEICDELISTDLFKFTGSLMNQLENNEEFQSLKRAKEDTENEYKKQLEMSQRNQHITQINLFKEQFKNVNNREPTNEEIIDNLKEDIDEEIIRNIIEPNEIVDVAVN